MLRVNLLSATFSLSLSLSDKKPLHEIKPQRKFFFSSCKYDFPHLLCHLGYLFRS